MPVSFERLIVGEPYDRPELAELWGFKDWHAIGRGVVTPKKDDKIVLFVTKEKQDSQEQYEDHFDGDLLFMEGEVNHANDERLADAEEAGEEIHLFYRERHHSPFTYFGQVWLSSHEIRDSPSKFIFNTKRSEALAASSLLTEELTHGQGEEFIGDTEGRKRYVLHITYERSIKNRTEAIRIHGAICNCCGFDFNLVYGPELAREFVEVHHVKSITKTVGQVNPANDLVPLCSNCHSMVHRKRGEIVPVEQLRKLLKDRGWKLPIVSAS